MSNYHCCQISEIVTVYPCVIWKIIIASNVAYHYSSLFATSKIKYDMRVKNIKIELLQQKH